MVDKQDKRGLIASLDEETRRWLYDYCNWKRRKVSDKGDFTLSFLKQYIDTHLYDYYFIQRNYTTFVPLLEAYSRSHGEVEGIDALLKDLQEVIKGGS